VAAPILTIGTEDINEPLPPFPWVPPNVMVSNNKEQVDDTGARMQRSRCLGVPGLSK
jgi:hypothetical protein